MNKKNLYMKKSKRHFKRWEKTIREDADWDFVFIWILEKKKLEHMLKFWEDYWSDRVKGSGVLSILSRQNLYRYH